MKQKLLLALLALFTLGGSNLFAQTDVTSTYITNADFSSTDGWTTYASSQFHSEGNGLIGTFVVTNSYTSTTDDTHLDTEYCFGVQCRWQTNYVAFQQTKESATFPAGVYTITYDVENTNTATTAGTSENYDNLFYVKVGETTYSDTSTEWMNGSSSWTTHTISFFVEEETTANFMISLGYGLKNGFNKGTSETPHIYVSHLAVNFTALTVPTALSLSSTTLALNPTATATLTPTYTPADANYKTDITWTTSDASVATVDNGVVTAIGAGTATITATTANSVSATCAVTVTDVTPVAAPSFYSEIAAGDFYIVNAATGKAIGTIKEGWGTQAGLPEHGIPFTVALGDGVYTLDSHTYNNSATAHYFTGTFVDGASTNLYINSLGDGKYSISTADGSAFVTANVNDIVVANTAPTANSVLAQWYFVSKENLESAMAAATTANPVDATFYIQDPDFSRNHILQLVQNGKTTLNPGNETYLWKYTATNYHFKGGSNGNMCAETYQNGGGKIYQELTGIKNGKYLLKAQAFHNGSGVTSLYANDKSIEVAVLNANGEGTAASMDGASTAFSAGQYKNELEVFVTDGNLTIGIENAGTNWACFDNFELYYLGPTIEGEAVELADPMGAGKWYYFDLDVDGTYNLTANTLSDIVYTNDGTVLIENEGTVTTQFAGAENQQLTAGRYYVKSSSEQTFTIAPASYDYNLGEVVLSTADGGYTQSSTFTVTFPNAATNDPAAALSLVDNSKATVNGTEVALTAVEKGFTFELGTIAANTEFVIAIPAAVYGYADHSMNEAINITIHTPAVLDGFYFLRTSAGKYVARGGDYNSRAVVDEFGLPLSVATDASGITQFTYVDNGGKLFLNGQGNAYTDNSTDPNWIFEATEGGYYIVHADGTYANNKLNVWSGDNKSLFATGTEGTVFVIEPVSEHNTYMEALKDAQAAAAAAALGNEEITTKAALATWLDANYAATPVTVAEVAFTEKWNGAASAEWGAGKDMYTATVNDLPEGLYKLTVNAYYRMNGRADAAEGARANVYLFGNDVKTQLYSVHDFPASEPWVSGNDQQDSYGYYPNNPTGGAAALSAGNYLNELYVYVSDGTLTYGIHQPSRFSNEQWFGFQNFTLTRYDAPVSITIKAGRQYTAFSYDKPLDFTNSELTAEIVTSATGTTQTVTKVPANTGIIVGLAQATTEAKTISVPVCAGETDDVTGNMLVAVLEATTIPQTVDGYTNYVFGKSGGKEQFFKVRAAGMEVPANNAYLTIPDAQAKGIDVIGLNGDATGISTIENADMQNGEVYNLQGQKVNRAQKGVYIVNGKKIVKK